MILNDVIQDYNNFLTITNHNDIKKIRDTLVLTFSSKKPTTQIVIELHDRLSQYAKSYQDTIGKLMTRITGYLNTTPTCQLVPLSSIHDSINELIALFTITSLNNTNTLSTFRKEFVHFRADYLGIHILIFEIPNGNQKAMQPIQMPKEIKRDRVDITLVDNKKVIVLKIVHNSSNTKCKNYVSHSATMYFYNYNTLLNTCSIEDVSPLITDDGRYVIDFNGEAFIIHDIINDSRQIVVKI